MMTMMVERQRQRQRRRQCRPGSRFSRPVAYCSSRSFGARPGPHPGPHPGPGRAAASAAIVVAVNATVKLSFCPSLLAAPLPAYAAAAAPPVICIKNIIHCNRKDLHKNILHRDGLWYGGVGWAKGIKRIMK